MSNHLPDGQTYRVFLSSPGDVAEERALADRVVQTINADYGYPALELILWEKDFYSATRTFQDQITSSAECELVICIFWKNLGSELPDHYRRADGRLPTGTEYEFETAIEQSLASSEGVPDVLVYRKTAEKKYDEDNLRQQEAQRARLNTFWTQWFENERGHFVAGFHVFETARQFQRDLDAHLRRWLRRKLGDVSWTGGAPYKGLLAFDLADEDIFFGRQRETQRTRARFLANAATGQRFLMVTGPSGSGKSSLLRAGVLPRLLRTQSMPDRPAFGRYAILRPAKLEGNWPKALADQLFTPEALEQELAAGDYDTSLALAQVLGGPPEAVVRPLAKALDRAASAQNERMALVLVLDQFEELFSWPEAERDAFLCLIQVLVTQADIFVIASMRSEYLHRVAENPILAALCQFSDITGRSPPILTLRPPTQADLRDLITGPAHMAGLHFEDGLDARIEAEAGPQTLPALQLALTKLYDARDDTILTHAAYEALGGVAGVMARQGNEALQEAPRTVRGAFAGLMRQLVISTDLRGTTVSRAAPLSVLTEDQAALAQRLIARGLLVSDDDHIRLAHEALIDGWDRLAEVILEDQALLQARHRLSLMAARFASDPTVGKAGLLQGHALEEGRQLAATWDAAQIGAEEPTLPDFIARSHKTAQGKVLRQRLGMAAAVLLVVGALFQGNRMRNDVQQSLLTAELGQSTAKAAQASLGSGDRAQAVRAALRARELFQTPDTLSLAATVMLAADSPHLVASMQGPFADISYGPDGRLVTLTRQGQLAHSDRIVDLPAPETGYHRAYVLRSGGVVAVAKTAIYVSPSGQVTPFPELDHALKPTREALRQIENGFVYAVRDVAAWQRNNQPISLFICQEGNDTINCQTETFGDRDADVGAVALDQRGETLAFATSAADSKDRFVDKITLATGDTSSFQVEGRTDHLGFAQGGLYRSYFDGLKDRVVIASTKTGEQLTILTEAHRVMGVASAQGLIAFGCELRVLCVAQLDSGTLRITRRLSHLQAPLQKIEFSPDATQLATLHGDGSLRQWDLTVQEYAVQVLPGTRLPVLAVDVDKAGDIFSLSVGSELYHWERTPGDRALYQRADGEGTRNVMTGPRGDHVVITDDGSVFSSGRDPIVEIILPDNSKMTRRYSWPIARMSPWGDDDVAAVGLQGVVIGDTEFPYSRFVSGNTRLGGVVAGRQAVFVSATDGSLHRIVGEETSLAVPHVNSADTLAGLSLDLSPSERFLVVTRADDRVLIHDLQEQSVSATLELPTQDSKVVAFSPSGDQLAVLTSAGGLGVWDFDQETGSATPTLFVDPVPQALKSVEQIGRLRSAQWIAWADENKLAIASTSGDVIVLDVRADVIEQALKEQGVRYDKMDAR